MTVDEKIEILLNKKNYVFDGLLFYSIWMGFTSFLIDTFSSLINSIDKEDGFLYYTWLGLLAYALPLLLNLLSLELYINFCKTKVDKWGFRIVWIIQALLCLGMMIYLGIHLFG